MLTRLKATRTNSTTDMSCSGSGKRKPKWTTAMVTICPTTAIQRSWMSCRMFSRPVWSSKMATPAPVSGTPPLLADDDPRANKDHERQPIPGDRIHQVGVAEGDHRQPTDGSSAVRTRFLIDKIRRHPA